jgi:hypothetical protein
MRFLPSVGMTACLTSEGRGEGDGRLRLPSPSPLPSHNEVSCHSDCKEESQFMLFIKRFKFDLENFHRY